VPHQRAVVPFDHPAFRDRYEPQLAVGSLDDLDLDIDAEHSAVAAEVVFEPGVHPRPGDGRVCPTTLSNGCTPISVSVSVSVTLAAVTTTAMISPSTVNGQPALTARHLLRGVLAGGRGWHMGRRADRLGVQNDRG
jgi:hypothetical protein